MGCFQDKNKFIIFRKYHILGRSAHPIVPFIGQGGCLALEDSFLLVIYFQSIVL